MADAIHCKETNKMEYKYKSYDPNEWKFYQSYLHLQKLQKFAGLRPTAVVESSRIMEAMSRDVEVEGKKQ